MVGIELADHDSAAAVEEACFRRGLLVLSAGDAAIRLAPPFVVTDAQVDRALELFAEACATAA